MADTQKSPSKDPVVELGRVNELARRVYDTTTELERIITRLNGLPDPVAGSWRAAIDAHSRAVDAQEALINHAHTLRRRHNRRMKWGF